MMNRKESKEEKSFMILGQLGIQSRSKIKDKILIKYFSCLKFIVENQELNWFLYRNVFHY